MSLNRILALLVLALISGCGGGNSISKPGPNNSPSPSAASSTAQEDICNCTFGQPVESDFRTAAKHVSIPSGTPTDVTVATILSWEHGADPSFNAGRSGRENQLFRIRRAYLQMAWVSTEDCDVHMEISETPDRSAPRVIVETPREGEYCSARRGIRDQLVAAGEQLSKITGDLIQPRPVEVTGLAFQDYDHPRGTAKVATPWEIHPATVKLIP